MSYVALYRSWRPQDFNNLVGQEHISETLSNALKVDKISHAYLFAGPRGTGKTTTAKIFAKALNCVNGPTVNPCNKCSSCIQITNGISMDVSEIDAASNRGINEIKELRESIKFSPVGGNYKIYIIDEAHMLTTEAFNAFLKTLEEPPKYTVFILATTEVHKIPATVHSRCQRYDFRKIAVKEIEKQLQSVVEKLNINITNEALNLIAIKADGSMRDALNILDQCSIININNITETNVRQLLGIIGYDLIFKLTIALVNKNSYETMMIIDDILIKGKEIKHVLFELVKFLRELMLYKIISVNDDSNLYENNNKVAYKELSEKITHDEIITAIKYCNEAIIEMRLATDARTVAEMALLNICFNETNIWKLEQRIDILEKTIISMGVSNKLVCTDTFQQLKIQNMSVSVNSDKKTMVNENIDSMLKKTPIIYNIKIIWEDVLKELIICGKRSIHACVSQGKLIEINDKKAIVHFGASFPKERTEKEDFREVVEKILAKIINKQIKLVCLLVNKKNITTDVEPLSSFEKENIVTQSTVIKSNDKMVNQALKMFGGEIMYTEYNKEVDL